MFLATAFVEYVLSCIDIILWIQEKGNACRILVGKPEGMRPLGKPRCRWVDNRS
jgi:hypothetical protein